MTKYRIVPDYNNNWLQFLSTRKILWWTVPCWRYVRESSHPVASEFHFPRNSTCLCMHDFDRSRLIEFTKKYPDISVYIAEMRKLYDYQRTIIYC